MPCWVRYDEQRELHAVLWMVYWAKGGEYSVGKSLLGRSRW